jgi:hypothetical protein
MPYKNERYGGFLTDYKFFTNSIEFRIHSSRALEKWKNVQSFQLNQLVNGRFYFEQEQREILLLNYDLWSKFLYEVENLCIELSGKKADTTISKEEVKFIVSLAKKVFAMHDTVVARNPDKFNIEFTEIWNRQHQIVNQLILEKLKSYTGISFNHFFTRTVDLFTTVGIHALIEIHELDFLMKRRDNNLTGVPFLIVNEFNQMGLDKGSCCLICGRLTVYKKYFDFNKIHLKNYTEEPIPFDVADKIESMGIGVDYKMSSRFGESHHI